jgi:probable rRNA maturation factor
VAHSEIAVDVQIDDEFVGRVNASLLIEAATTTLRHQKVDRPVELTIVVVGDGQVRRLNREFRHVDEPTDVLAFPSEEDSFLRAEGMPHYLGDVIISFDRASAQAQRAGHSVGAELQLLIVHGVLHLLSYDHAEPEEKSIMWAAQSAVLNELGAALTNYTPEE